MCGEPMCRLGDPKPERETCGAVYLMPIGGDRWPPHKEWADARCEVRGNGDDIFARSTLLPLVQIRDEFAYNLVLGVRGILEPEME